MKTVNVTELVNQVRMVRLKAEALAADTRVLEETLISSIRESIDEQLPKQDTGPECKCPITARIAAAVNGHPSRTKCRKCGKEHD